jgi:hypothetical protein
MYIKEEKKYLKINASEVSGCIGDNKYLSKEVMVFKLWKRIHNESFEKAIKRNNINLINIKDMDTNNNINKKYIKNYNKTINNRENGLNNEPKIIDIYQSMKKVSIKDNNKKLYSIFVNKSYNKLLYYTTIISGFIDGIVEDSDNRYIVEIKDRQNKLFYKVPDHEITQITIYMKMTNIYECHHIERYKDEFKTEIIKFDNEKWNIIEKKIINFVDYFEKIYFNVMFQDLFLKKVLKNITIKNELSSNMGIVLELNLT